MESEILYVDLSGMIVVSRHLHTIYHPFITFGESEQVCFVKYINEGAFVKQQANTQKHAPIPKSNSNIH